MTLSTNSGVSEIIADWKQFRSGHKSLSEVREKIISAQENGTRFFAEDSAPELGPEMMNDGALRHELTAAEMAFKKGAITASTQDIVHQDASAVGAAAYYWLAERAESNPYAHHISEQRFIDVEYYTGIPAEAPHDVPGLSDAQKQAAAMSLPNMQRAERSLRSQADVYFQDGEKAFEHITSNLSTDGGETYTDLIEQSGSANSFRSGLLRLKNTDAQDEAQVNLRHKIEEYHLNKIDSVFQVEKDDMTFRESLASITPELGKVMSVAQTQAHPDTYTKDIAQKTLSNIKERYDQHMLKQGAGLTEHAASQLIAISQTLPSLVERPDRVTPDLSMFSEETPLAKVANALTGKISSEDAHEVLDDLEWIASPSTASVFRSEAKSNPQLAEQASVVRTLIRDRLPDVIDAIERAEIYDYSEVAVISQDVVDKLTSEHTNKALARLSAVVSSAGLKENLTSAVRHKADASQEHRPQMRPMP